MMTTEASERSWFVYVLLLRNPDGKIYTSQTGNVPHRLYQHNDPTHTLTRTTTRFSRTLAARIYSEAARSRSAALSREKH